jgi:two-component system LytT family response regulator
MTNCIIVDDEQLARDLLMEYLADHDEVAVVAQCAKGSEAIEKINALEPDLVFMDVQMPGLDGFDVLERINTDPFIIFCTAYDKYALKAFDQNAIDYLLKPLDKDRFDRAVDKAISRIKNDDKNFEHLLEEITGKGLSNFPSRLFVQKSEKLINLPVQNIVHLEASKDYTIISSKDDQYVSSLGISKLEAKLDPDVFIRIHRSTIINLDHLNEIEKQANGGLSAVMDNGKSFPVSRSYTAKIRNRIV